MTDRTYIITYNPTLRVVGPFTTESNAAIFGGSWQKANADNPCWNTIRLPGDPIAQIVIDVERPATAVLVQDAI